MDAHVAQPTWAGRVRNGIKNSFEYNKDTEVTCKLINGKDRSDIYKLLQEIQFGHTNFEGIVTRPGQLVDFTLKNKITALKFANMLKENPKVKDVLAHVDNIRDVRLSYVPPNFPEQPIIDYMTLNHGQIEKTYRLKDIYGIQTGTRVYKLQRRDLEVKPIPSYLYFGKYKFAVKYEGQDNTCAYCAENGHTEKQCPQKQQLKIFKVGNKRKIQPETPNNDPRSEPETKKIIQRPSSNMNKNKKTSHSRQNQARENQTNNSSLQSSAPNPDKQQSSTANHETENVSHDREVNTIRQSNNSKQPITTTDQNNTAQSFNDELDEFQSLKKQQTRKLRKRIRSPSSSLEQESKNPNLNQTKEKENKVSIFSSSSSISDNEYREFYRNNSELFLKCCQDEAERCKNSYFRCKNSNHDHRYFKCKCSWRLIDTDSPNYKCHECLVNTAQCPHCHVYNLNENNTRIKCTYCKAIYEPLTF